MLCKNFKISEADLIAFKKRRYSRIAVQKALKCGKLHKPLCCNQCLDKVDLEAHHIDYGQPLVVMWLCSACHGKAHRKDSPLHPNNNAQSPMPFIGERYKNVTITFTMPVENYLALQAESDSLDKSISEIVRKQIMNKYPVVKRQLELFEEINDEPQKIIQSRVCSLDKNESLRPERKYPAISKIRGKRNLNSRGMDKEFPSVYGGYGYDAFELQRTCVNR